MMEKQLFCKTMKNFVEKFTAVEEWIEKASDVFGGVYESLYEHSYESNIVNLIRELMEDEESWLDYFIYERKCEWFDIEEDGKTIWIDSYEKLYDLIVTSNQK